MPFVFLLLWSCKSAQQIQIQEKYFEEFQQKKISPGHYGGYFILDGTKRIYRLKVSDQDEIIIESDEEEGQVVYEDRDFFRHMVILYKEDKVYRVVKGKLNIYKEKDKLEANIDVLGIKDMWELVSDTIPEVEDGLHHKLIFEGRIKQKEEEEN